MVTMTRRRLVVIVVVTISVAVLAVIGVRVSKSKLFATTKAREAPKVPVIVEPATRGEIRRTLTLPGDLHAEREALVFTLANARVVRYNYREGDEVSKGATLAVLDREEKWNRYKPLLIDAPISGRVAEIYLQPGEYATTQTPLCLLIGGKNIRTLLSAPDPDLRMIRPSMEAVLSVPTIPGRTFTGKVTHVTPFIQSDTRTGEVEVAFENGDSALLPGMYGDVTIVLDRKSDVLIIPLVAVLYEEGGSKKPYVFVIKDDLARKMYVELGILEEKRAEAAEGLQEGDLVVTVGKENLSEGTPVIVVKDR